MGWWVALCDDGTTTNTSKGGGTWESGAFIFLGGGSREKKNCGGYFLTFLDEQESLIVGLWESLQG